MWRRWEGEGEVRPASGRQEPNQEVFLSRVSAAAEKSGRCKQEAATGGCARDGSDGGGCCCCCLPQEQIVAVVSFLLL